jgi:CheY-like chemotaxis protein
LQSNLTYLIVEDHPSGIDELARLLLRTRGPQNLQLQFAGDVQTAIEQLEARFDAVVVDVMLPWFEGVHETDEGVYLAAWILGFEDELPASLRGKERPAWMVSQPCPVVLLTSRKLDPVKKLLERLARQCRANSVLLIDRTEDVRKQRDRIVAFLDGKVANAK